MLKLEASISLEREITECGLLFVKFVRRGFPGLLHKNLQSVRLALVMALLS